MSLLASHGDLLLVEMMPELVPRQVTRDWHQPLKREEEGGGAVGGASGGDNAFKRAALVRYVLLLIARCDVIFVTKIGTGQARQRTGRS